MLQVLHLFDLDTNFSLETSQFFIIIRDLWVKFGFLGLKRGDFLGLSVVLGVKLLINGLKTCQFRECTLIFSFQVSVNWMHVVKFGFEFEAKLHFFFMIFCVLHVLFLKFQSHLSLTIFLLLEIITESLKCLNVLLELHLILCLFIEFLLKLAFHAVHLLLMLFRDLRDEHAVIGFATVLKKDWEHFPDWSYDWVFALGMLKTLLH